MSKEPIFTQKPNKWSVCKEGNALNIMRWISLSGGRRRAERLQVSGNNEYKILRRKYKEGSAARKDFEEMAMKLNEPLILNDIEKRTWRIKCGFVSGNFHNQFKQWLLSRTDIDNSVNATLGHMNNYVIQYFTKENNIPNFKQWCLNVNQDGFLYWLIEKKLSAGTISSIRNSTNNFIKFLSYNSDGEIRYQDYRISFPLLTPKLKQKIKEELDNNKTEHMRLKAKKQFIPLEDFERLLKATMGSYLHSLIFIGYHYGLRPAETLAISEKSIKNGWIFVEGQAKNVKENKRTKGGMKRKIPHFLLDQNTKLMVLELISTIQSNRVSPKKLSRDFSKLCDELNLTYVFKDLRGTFITRHLDQIGTEFEIMKGQIDKITAQKVQQAAGHTDMAVTLSYQRDLYTSSLAEEQFVG